MLCYSWEMCSVQDMGTLAFARLNADAGEEEGAGGDVVVAFLALPCGRKMLERTVGEEEQGSKPSETTWAQGRYIVIIGG